MISREADAITISDSDQDGINDLYEIFIYGTDPDLFGLRTNQEQFRKEFLLPFPGADSDVDLTGSIKLPKNSFEPEFLTYFLLNSFKVSAIWRITIKQQGGKAKLHSGSKHVTG